jgi:hypothetical protein
MVILQHINVSPYIVTNPTAGVKPQYPILSKLAMPIVILNVFVYNMPWRNYGLKNVF